MKKYFESRQAAAIVGIPERTLRYWATAKFISAAQDAQGRPGIRRQYSFENLVEAAILRELSKQGVTMSVAAKAVAVAREKKFGDMGKDLCYLRIVGGKAPQAITMKEVTNAPNIQKRVESLCAALKEAEKAQKDPKYAKLIKFVGLLPDQESLIQFGGLLTELTYLRAMWGELFGSDESAFIVPVDKLCLEIAQKVEREQ